MKHSYLIKPVLDERYAVITHGKGIYLFDEDGKAYIDGSSGAVTASIGHGVQEVAEAMKAQADKVSFVYRSQFTTDAAELLARKLKEIAPGDLNWSFFVNSGSEATETAMKIAIQYWQEKGMPSKNMIISRKMSYHGMTMGALSMSGHPDRRERFEPMLLKCPSISAPYYYRDANGRTEEACDIFYAEEFERAIIQLGSENIAAFIAEPIVGAAGAALTPSGQYFKRIKQICEAHNILFIADEVMTGLGRTGKMFAMEYFGAVPDMMTIGKGVSAGYTPIAATMISEAVMAPIAEGSKTILGGHTFSANPQSAATALAVLRYIKEHHLVEKSAELGEYLHDKLKVLAEASSIIGDVRGKGLFAGIEFVADKYTKKSFDRMDDMTKKIVKYCFEQRLLVYPSNAGSSGNNGDAIIIAPPLTITREEIDDLVNRFQSAIQQVEKQLQKEHLK